MSDKKPKFTTVMAAKEMPEHVAKCLVEQPSRSGMFNWMQVFKGEINTWWSIKDNIEDYDIVHINMSPADMSIIADVKRTLRNSTTKLVLNNDYVTEFWEKWGIDPYRYDQLQRLGDMVFSTEPHQVSNMIDGTFVIPHPTNTARLKKLGTDYESDSVGFIYHWWWGQTAIPQRTLNKVKEKYGVKKTTIFGYHDKDDFSSKYSKIMWDKKVPQVHFPQFAELIQGERAIYDPNPCHTYGRNGVELACWKKPVVGSNRVFSYNYLFPELTCDPFDAKAALGKFDIIFKDPSRTKEILDKAYKKVEYFNYDNSRKRFLDALKISTERGGSDWYMKNG